MSNRRNEMEAAVINTLRAYPVRFEFGRGSKHPYVDVHTNDGRTRRMWMAGSPSCWRAVAKKRSDIKREMRAMGIEPLRHIAKQATIGDVLADAAAAASGEGNEPPEAFATFEREAIADDPWTVQLSAALAGKRGRLLTDDIAAFLGTIASGTNGAKIAAIMRHLGYKRRQFGEDQRRGWATDTRTELWIKLPPHQPPPPPVDLFTVAAPPKLESVVIPFVPRPTPLEEKPMLDSLPPPSKPHRKGAGVSTVQRITIAESTKVTVLLMQNGILDIQTSSYDYHDGWSDLRMAEVMTGALGRSISEAEIIRVRQEVGLTSAERLKKELRGARAKARAEKAERQATKTRDPVAQLQALLQRMKDLESRLDAIEAIATAPQQVKAVC